MFVSVLVLLYRRFFFFLYHFGKCRVIHLFQQSWSNSIFVMDLQQAQCGSSNGSNTLHTQFPANYVLRHIALLISQRRTQPKNEGYVSCQVYMKQFSFVMWKRKLNDVVTSSYAVCFLLTFSVVCLSLVLQLTHERVSITTKAEKTIKMC